ncbi:MAG: MATE family efflux transporter [Flavobacteriales bacterium]
MSFRAETTRTWKLSGPIILGELTQMALGIIDNMMVGAISYKHLAAAALVLSVMNIPFVLGIGITMSVSQLVSMAHGRRDGQQVSHYLYNGFWMCAATALLIAILLHTGSDILFYLKQDPEVAALAKPYLIIMGWSTVPMLMFMAIKQFTDGLEYTRTAMILSLAALPMNIFLNWILIYGNLGMPRLELVGAGIGTLATRVIILIALTLIVFRHRTFRRYIAVRRSQWALKWKTVKELLHIGIPSSLQAGMESGAFAVSGIIIGTLGAVEQAAHQIALSCAAFTFMVSMGLAQGGSIRISNAWGRRNWADISLIGRSTLVSGLAYGIFCSIFFISARNYLPLAFNDNAAVVAIASVLMFYAAVFQISDATQAIGVGILRGIKDVKIPTIYVALAYWVIGIPVGCLMAFGFKMGAAGMWIGFVTGLTVVSVLLNKRFFNRLRREKASGNL